MTRRFDPLAAMMAAHGGQPMVGMHPALVGVNEFPGAYGAVYGAPAHLYPGPARGVPELPPAVSTGPMAPPGYCGPMGPALGYSAFTSPAILARGMRAQALKSVPQRGLGGRTVAGTPVAANTAGVQITTAAPSAVLCVTDLEWHAASAQFFLISSILAAGREWLVAGGSVPATSFTPDGIHPTMEFPTCWPGVTIQVTVENIDGGPHATSFTFWAIAGDSQSCQ